MGIPRGLWSCGVMNGLEESSMELEKVLFVRKFIQRLNSKTLPAGRSIREARHCGSE